MESTTPNRELHEMTAYLVLLSFQLLKVNKNELEWLGEHLKCTFSQLTSYGRIDTGEIKMYNVELCNQIRSHLNISDNELLCELNSGPLVCNDTHTAWYSHRRRIVLKYVDESSIVRLQTNFKKYAEYMLLHGMTTHLDRIINFIRVTRGNVAVYFVVSITPYPIIGCELVHAIKLNCIPHQFIETKTNKQHQRNNNGNANGNGLSKMMSSLLHKDKQPSDIKTNENKLKNLIYYGEMVDDTYFNENYVDNIALHNTLVEKPETSSCVPSEVWAGIENNDKQTPDKSGSIESSNINVDNIILQTKPNTSLTPPLESVEYGPNENKWYTDIEGVNKLAYMAKANTEPNQLMMDDALIVLEAISKEPISEARKNGRYVACVDFESVCENIHADHLKSLEVDADVEYSIELGSSDRRTLLSELKEDIAFIESIMGYKYSLQCVAIKRLTEGKLTAPGGVFGPNVSEAMNPSSQRNTFVARHDRDYSDQFQPHFSEFHIPINRKLVTPEEDPYWLYTNKTPQCIPKAYFSKRRKDVEFHFSFDNIFESYEIEDRFKKLVENRKCYAIFKIINCSQCYLSSYTIY